MSFADKIRFSDDKDSRKITEQFKREFKKRTGLDYPGQSDLAWRQLLGRAGFKPEESRAIRTKLPDESEIAADYSGHGALLTEIYAQLEDPKRTEKKLFPNGVPDDTDLVDAIVKLDNERSPGNTDMDLLRGFTGETRDDCPYATKLQSRIRKARSDGRTTLPARD